MAWALSILLTVTAICACVLTHYFGLTAITFRVRGGPHRERRIVLLAVIGVLALHVIEVGLFGLAGGVVGLLAGGVHATAPQVAIDNHWLTYLYLAAVSYTTIGFGELVPLGASRLLCSAAGLTGLAMIGWSASFVFFEMERHWRER